MALFEYRCQACNSLFDILHKGQEIIKDIQCPSCGSNHYTKLFSLTSVITKEVSGAHCETNTCGMNPSNCGGRCGFN